jgi:hypothetical protein
VHKISYNAFDPRGDIRTAIGHTHYMLGEDLSTVSVTYPSGELEGDTCYIPLYLPGECRTEELPPMPFIEMTLVTSPVGVHNVQGDVRDQECYLDFNLYYTNTDAVVATEFGKTVADELVDKIMSHRHNISDCSWCEVLNDGREIIESYNAGKLVVFHRVIECYAQNYDSG